MSTADSSSQAKHHSSAEEDVDNCPKKIRKCSEITEPECENVHKKIKVIDSKEDKKLDTKNTSVPSDLSTNKNEEKSCLDGKKQHTDQAELVTKHYNSIEDKGLFHRNQSRIVYMRNFNNWIKSMIINQFMEKIKQEKGFDSRLKVLDLCCGKGGDLLKWKKAFINHLICCDIADISMNQCQRRYNDLYNRDRKSGSSFTAEFITADCTKVRLREKYQDPSVQLDCVSCQFALHYSFESLQQAECMLRNASENLRPGGYFIGSIPDAYDLVAKCQKSAENKFGNEVYNVEFLCDKEKPPLFGAKYNFQLDGVVNCPEFLVYMPTLCKLAEKFDLELVMCKRFEDYYESMLDKGKVLLGVMQGFETYPPRHSESLVGKNSQDYDHAQQFISNLPSHSRVGTLSRTEWEAASLYLVFAFKKKNNTGKEKSQDK